MINYKDVKVVIFDCDGVLINSEIYSAKAFHDALTELGYNYTLEYYMKNFSGKPYDIIQKEISTTNRPLPENFIQNVVDTKFSLYEDKITATNGIKNVLADLKLPFCVASSSKMPYLKKFLGQSDLLQFFGSNYFSAAVAGRAKPFPDVYLYAAKQMGVSPSDCIAVEDSIPGVKAARSAGIPVIAYTGGGHIIDGYEKDLMDNGAEFFFNNMNDFKARLPNFFK